MNEHLPYIYKKNEKKKKKRLGKYNNLYANMR